MSDTVDPADRILPSQGKVMVAGRWLRRLFTALLALDLAALIFVALFALLVEALIHLPPAHFVGANQLCAVKACIHTTVIDHGRAVPLISDKSVYYMVVLILSNLAPLLVIWRLRALCGLYEKGVVFSRQNVRHIRWIGLGLLAWAASPTAGHLLLTPFDADLNGDFKALTDWGQICVLLIAAVAFLAAQIMQMGREIDEEQRQFI